MTVAAATPLSSTLDVSVCVCVCVYIVYSWMVTLYGAGSPGWAG